MTVTASKSTCAMLKTIVLLPIMEVWLLPLMPVFPTTHVTRIIVLCMHCHTSIRATTTTKLISAPATIPYVFAGLVAVVVVVVMEQPAPQCTLYNRWDRQNQYE